MRKDVYLVTKCSGYNRHAGRERPANPSRAPDASLERLRTDYVDAYYLHGIDGNAERTAP